MAFLASTLFMSSNLQAEETKVGIVDGQYILNNAKAAQDVRSKIEAKWTSYQAEIKEKEDKLRKNGQKLAEEKAKLSQEAFEKKRQAYDAELAALQSMVNGRKATLDSAFQNSMTLIETTMTEIINEIMKEKDFNIVLYKNQVVMASPEMDVTKMAMERLDKKLAKVDVKFEEKTEKSAK